MRKKKQENDHNSKKNDESKMSDIFIYNVLDYTFLIVILWKKCWKNAPSYWIYYRIVNFITIYVMRCHNKRLYIETPDHDEREDNEQYTKDNNDEQKVSDIFIYNVLD